MIYINNNIFGGLDESKALIFVVDTSKIESGSSTNVQYKIPLQLKTGLYDVDCKYIIKWGDTTQSTITSSVDANLLHTYPFAGEYTIKIYPLSGASRISFFVNNLANRDRLKIREINQVGFAEIDSLYGCANMRAFTATDFSTYWNTKTDMSYMFAGWNTFNATLPSGFGNFPLATNVSYAFQSWFAFNQTLPAGFGNYPNATNIDRTYQNWLAFNQALPSGFGNYPNAISVVATYYDWRVFNQALPSGFGNFPLAINVSYAFQSWYAFNQSITLTTSASLTYIVQAFHLSIFKNITISNCTNVSTITIYTFNVVPLETLIVNNLKISFTIQYSTFTKTAYLDLIASLKDMTALTSPTMTVKNVPAFDMDCDNAAAAKNWTVVKI